MLTATSPESISKWPLSPSTRSTVLAELVAPFGSIESTIAFWQEESCQIIALTNQDDAKAYINKNPHLKLPEFVVDAEEGWCLSLTITSQSGGGTYLLFQTNALPELASLISNDANKRGTDDEHTNG